MQVFHSIMLERERNLSLALPCIWIVIGQTNFQRSLRLQVENGLWHQLNLTSQQSADLKKLVEKFHFPLSQIYWARLAKVIKVISDFFFSTRKVREFGLIFLQVWLKHATIQAFLSLILFLLFLTHDGFGVKKGALFLLSEFALFLLGFHKQETS